MKTPLRRHSETPPVPATSGSRFSAWLPALLLAAVLVLAPLFPDVKLTRPKLLLLENGLYALLFLWLAFSFLRGELRLRRSTVILPLAVYACVEVLFYAFSPDRPVALAELKRCLLSVTAYFAAAHAVASKNQRDAVIAAWLGGSLLASLYALLQHSGGIGFIGVPRMDRVMSTFGNPIFFAAHLVVTLPVAFGFLLSSRRPWLRLLAAACLLAGLPALYYAQTRAAFIGLAAALAVFSFTQARAFRARVLLLGGLAAVFALFVGLTGNLWLRHQEHLLIWRDTLSMWLNRPWFGTGPGTFHIYFPQFASPELKAVWPQHQFIVNDAHNEYVQYLSETGIAGFGIFLWLLVSVYRNAGRILAGTEGKDRFLAAGLLAGVSGLLVQNVFSVDMRFIVSAVYLFLAAGLLETFSGSYLSRDGLRPAVRFAGIAAVAGAALFAFPRVWQPYIAQHRVASRPDFFDEKVLEPAKTIAELDALAVRYPDQSTVFEKLGWVYAKEKNWPKAVENLEHAHKLNPRSSGPLNNLGNISFLLGDRGRAIEYWTRSLALNPAQVDSRLNLAVAYYYNGQLKESSQQLKEVLRVDPGNEKAIVMLKQMVE